MPIIENNITTMTGSEFKEAINKAMIAQDQWSFNLDFKWPTDDKKWWGYGNLYGFLLTFTELENGENINNFLSAPQAKESSYDLLLSLASITKETKDESNGQTKIEYFPPSLSAIQQFNNIAHVIIQPAGLEFYCYSKEKFLPDNIPMQLRGTFMPSYVPENHYYKDDTEDSALKVDIPSVPNS